MRSARLSEDLPQRSDAARLGAAEPDAVMQHGSRERRNQGARCVVPEYKGMNLIMPEGDRELRPYFVAAREGRLMLRRCGECGLLRYPPGSGCPCCSSLKSEWV